MKTIVRVFDVLPGSEQETELSNYLSSIGDSGSYMMYTSATNSGFGTTHKVSNFITVVLDKYEEADLKARPKLEAKLQLEKDNSLAGCAGRALVKNEQNVTETPRAGLYVQVAEEVKETQVCQNQ
jgi:hypothetical protein